MGYPKPVLWDLFSFSFRLLIWSWQWPDMPDTSDWKNSVFSFQHNFIILDHLCYCDEFYHTVYDIWRTMLRDAKGICGNSVIVVVVVVFVVVVVVVVVPSLQENHRINEREDHVHLSSSLSLSLSLSIYTHFCKYLSIFWGDNFEWKL
jgi:hypothetical protein